MTVQPLRHCQRDAGNDASGTLLRKAMLYDNFATMGNFAEDGSFAEEGNFTTEGNAAEGG
jgi:hypothetical protein